MLPPKLPENLREETLEEAVCEALNQETDVEQCHFYGEDLPDLAGETLEFSGCCFEKCVFRSSGSERLIFVDCVLDKCDLSGMRFEKSTFQRVSFRGCRIHRAHRAQGQQQRQHQRQTAFDLFHDIRSPSNP